MKHRICILVVSLSLAACAGGASTAPTSPSAAAQGETVQPDSGAARNHFEKHVNYPATRSTILAACANTTEFSEAEKRWFERKLPDREYKSAAEVIAAVGL
jgi:hypothetical protein